MRRIKGGRKVGYKFGDLHNICFVRHFLIIFLNLLFSVDLRRKLTVFGGDSTSPLDLDVICQFICKRVVDLLLGLAQVSDLLPPGDQHVNKNSVSVDFANVDLKMNVVKVQWRGEVFVLDRT